MWVQFVSLSPWPSYTSREVTFYTNVCPLRPYDLEAAIMEDQKLEVCLIVWKQFCDDGSGD
ncbi:hypothetical protein I79_021597 [Cricetulus griseus]|uniref:Uncharacterized protein n=1 Tax=Cricetulus griseus TaxID=10029 RepID=G3ID31_CRIGR|nr:hypothetical protein I79_021597 [Cricetulus griseus]